MNIFKKEKPKRDKVKSKLTSIRDESINTVIDPNYNENIMIEKIRKHNVYLKEINLEELDLDGISYDRLINGDIFTVLPTTNKFIIDGFFINTRFVDVPQKTTELNNYIFNNRNKIKKITRYYYMVAINNHIGIISGGRSFQFLPNKTYKVNIEKVHTFNKYEFIDLDINTNYKSIFSKVINNIIERSSIYNNIDKLVEDFKHCGLNPKIIKTLKNSIRIKKLKNILKKT